MHTNIRLYSQFEVQKLIAEALAKKCSDCLQQSIDIEHECIKESDEEIIQYHSLERKMG